MPVTHVTYGYPRSSWGTLGFGNLFLCGYLFACG
jgi:hypothetical protein